MRSAICFDRLASAPESPERAATDRWYSSSVRRDCSRRRDACSEICPVSTPGSANRLRSLPTSDACWSYTAFVPDTIVERPTAKKFRPFAAAPSAGPQAAIVARTDSACDLIVSISDLAGSNAETIASPRSKKPWRMPAEMMSARFDWLANTRLTALSVLPADFSISPRMRLNDSSWFPDRANAAVMPRASGMISRIASWLFPSSRPRVCMTDTRPFVFTAAAKPPVPKSAVFCSSSEMICLAFDVGFSRLMSNCLIEVTASSAFWPPSVNALMAAVTSSSETPI